MSTITEAVGKIGLVRVVVGKVDFLNRLAAATASAAPESQWGAEATVAFAQTDTDPPHLLVRLGARLRAASDPPPPYDLSVELVGEFESERALSEPEVQQFAAVDAVRVLWPFVQELVVNLTARTGMPPLVLPMPPFEATSHDQSPVSD